MSDLALVIGHRAGLHATAVAACPVCPHLCAGDGRACDGIRRCWQDPDGSFRVNATRHHPDVGDVDYEGLCPCELHVEQHAREYAPHQGRSHA